MVRVLHNYSNHVVVGPSPLEVTAKAARSRRPTEEATTPVRPAKQLRPREIDVLVERYAETRNMRAVAREFAMSRTTVAKHLADRGVDTSRGMKRDDIVCAVEMYAEGMSSVNIGKRLGFDNHTVISALRSEGVAIRNALGKN